ncbi:MAG: hypothetical protein BWY21_02128 [Parcubacteria group bacterium ADurb.Bin216]|nr:MAG: hypothetical protein BWY21_02128 [Parcubacteria group bacterium ADurb.Bin216]
MRTLETIQMVEIVRDGIIDDIRFQNDVIELTLISTGTGRSVVLKVTDQKVYIIPQNEVQPREILVDEFFMFAVLPYKVMEVLHFLMVVQEELEFDADVANPELEIIATNKQFFLDREDAFVPAGVLCAAGIVDEFNMEVE